MIIMEQNQLYRANGNTDRSSDNGDNYNRYTYEEIIKEAYKHPDLMSLLSENLMYCSDIGAALYAVAADDEKALLETFCREH